MADPVEQDSLSRILRGTGVRYHKVAAILVAERRATMAGRERASGSSNGGPRLSAYVTAEAPSQGSQFGNGTHRRKGFRRTSSSGGLQKRIYNNLGISGTSGAGLRHNDGAQRYTSAYTVTARQRWLHHVVHEGDFARVGQLAPTGITHLNERDYEGRAEDKRKERQIKELLAGWSASEAKVSSTRALVEPENTAIRGCRACLSRRAARSD